MKSHCGLSAASLLDWYSLLDIIEIATDTGREPADVAPLYYVVSERFGIDAMLGQGPAACPRDDRWDSLARGALRDDLYAVLESLTRSVIDVGFLPRCWTTRRRCGRRGSRANKDSHPAQQDRAVGDPPARQPQHRRALGRPADPALGDSRGRLHLTSTRL